MTDLNYHPNWIECLAVPGHGHLHVRGAHQEHPNNDAVYHTAAKTALWAAISTGEGLSGVTIDLKTMSRRGCQQQVDLVVNFPGDSVGSDLIMPVYAAVMGLAMGRRVNTNCLFMGQSTLLGVCLPIEARQAFGVRDIRVLQNDPSPVPIDRVFLSVGQGYPQLPAELIQAACAEGKRRINLVAVGKLGDLVNRSDYSVFGEPMVEAAADEEGKGVWGWVSMAVSLVKGKASKGGVASHMCPRKT